MIISVRNIIKWTVYSVHILSGIGIVILYLLFIGTDFFYDAGVKAILVFIGSALISSLFYKSQKQGLKIYFFALSGIALAYIGLWLVLGLLMTH